MKVILTFVVLFALSIKINGLKMLAVLPIEAKSHFAIGNSIVKTLLNAGHEITSIAPYPLKKVPKNLTHIDMSDSSNKPGRRS